jgi:hypothetical protein
LRPAVVRRFNIARTQRQDSPAQNSLESRARQGPVFVTSGRPETRNLTEADC